ncbi:hypothetical protein [Micromonospora musae]|uniref:hypothetical protein n=1 Tax=Micromonospora musae TaxID=1894970 RepID=UPI0033FC517C
MTRCRTLARVRVRPLAPRPDAYFSSSRSVGEAPVAPPDDERAERRRDLARMA